LFESSRRRDRSTSYVPALRTAAEVDARVSGIREQGIDLLLWEELVSSPEFLSWFLREAGVTLLDLHSELALSVDGELLLRGIRRSDGVGRA
jgi:hypothetical protein